MTITVYVSVVIFSTFKPYFCICQHQENPNMLMFS